MTINKFNELATMAKRIGIYTFGELEEYKRRNAIKTNADLYNSLFFELVRR